MQAEEAVECERATADELLALLKEKESEILQLRLVLLSWFVMLAPRGLLSHDEFSSCCRYCCRG